MSTTTVASLACSPSQSLAAPAGDDARRFDPLFERYRGAIPIEYLRALVEHESGGNPDAQSHAARGLLQIRTMVLTDYNTRHGTAYQPEHLLDPAINIAIGCELLRLIIASYHRHHPQVANLRADWTNPRFVELLTFGWALAPPRWELVRREDAGRDPRRDARRQVRDRSARPRHLRDVSRSVQGSAGGR